jgi:nucleolar protein 56
MRRMIPLRVARAGCGGERSADGAVRALCSDLERFGRVVKLVAFKPFSSAADSLEQINAISEANLTEELKTFLGQNLPKVGAPLRDSKLRAAATEHRVSPCLHPPARPTSTNICLPSQVKEGKKAKFKLGVFEPKLGSIIQETTSVPCMSNDVVGEVVRGIRANLARFIQVAEPDMKRAQLGLAHSYSRAKVKFNVNKVDNMIIQVSEAGRAAAVWTARPARLDPS